VLVDYVQLLADPEGDQSPAFTTAIAISLQLERPLPRPARNDGNEDWAPQWMAAR
jgi:hypothetical protein